MKEKLILDISDVEYSAQVCHALASPIRLRILSLLDERPLNISEICQRLQVPLSSTATAVNILEKAGLVISRSTPGVRGAQKLCALRVDSLFMQVKKAQASGEEDTYVERMPIGNYCDFQIGAPCGILSEHGYISNEDSPYGFFLPEHTKAQLIWFSLGYLEYRFFNRQMCRKKEPRMIEFSFEMCSEAPGYDSNWKSDITVWLNGVRIGTLFSSGDFGNRRGQLNPDWWDNNNTQYGLLHRVCVMKEGTLLDDEFFPEFTIADFHLRKTDYISLKIGVEKDAQYAGGINLFGEKFGDYPQPIVMRAVF